MTKINTILLDAFIEIYVVLDHFIPQANQRVAPWPKK